MVSSSSWLSLRSLYEPCLVVLRRLDSLEYGSPFLIGPFCGCHGCCEAVPDFALLPGVDVLFLPPPFSLLLRFTALFGWGCVVGHGDFTQFSHL